MLDWGPPLTKIYGLTLRDLRDMTLREIERYIDYATQAAERQRGDV